MANPIFDLIDDLTTKKTPWNNIPEATRKQYQPYMINRWLSMDREWLDIIAETQRYTVSISPRLNYIFYRDILPKKKLWLKYTKVQGEKQSILERVYKMIASRLLLSEAESQEAFELLMATGNSALVRDFLKGFGLTDSEVSKLIKSSETEG